jgi:hypothetical protein
MKLQPIRPGRILVPVETCQEYRPAVEMKHLPTGVNSAEAKPDAHGIKHLVVRQEANLSRVESRLRGRPRLNTGNQPAPLDEFLFSAIHGDGAQGKAGTFSSLLVENRRLQPHRFRLIVPIGHHSPQPQGAIGAGRGFHRLNPARIARPQFHLPEDSAERVPAQASARNDVLPARVVHAHDDYVLLVETELTPQR